MYIVLRGVSLDGSHQPVTVVVTWNASTPQGVCVTALIRRTEFKMLIYKLRVGHSIINKLHDNTYLQTFPPSSGLFLQITSQLIRPFKLQPPFGHDLSCWFGGFLIEPDDVSWARSLPGTGKVEHICTIISATLMMMKMTYWTLGMVIIIVTIWCGTEVALIFFLFQLCK